jgi:hypothetical protein
MTIGFSMIFSSFQICAARRHSTSGVLPALDGMTISIGPTGARASWAIEEPERRKAAEIAAAAPAPSVRAKLRPETGIRVSSNVETASGSFRLSDRSVPPMVESSEKPCQASNLGCPI